MPEDFSMTVKGLDEVDARLAKLTSQEGTRVIRSVMFTASKPLLDATVANIRAIPRGSGALAKAERRVFVGAGSRNSGAAGSRFVMAIAPKTKDKTAIALANLFYKRKRPIRGVFWGHLVEWDHRIAHKKTGRLTRAQGVRGLKRSKLHTGAGTVQGKHVHERAIRSAGPEVVEIFRKKIGPAVERMLKKLGKS